MTGAAYLKKKCDRGAGGKHLCTLTTRCCPLISCMQYKLLIRAQHVSVVCIMAYACIREWIELGLTAVE